MKKDKSELDDELLPEYDLKSLRVRKLGSGRKSFGSAIVRLEPDVAEMFPSADDVNEALRLLIQISQRQAGKNSATFE
ncbi:hypothetical protein [Chamaesiphon sp. GL140_3_metabinner_50]|uniref:hypothetical protein n=1 Tax=Chamaesiphon sp. GL140_3_metabinner_50 TaxID=2970812 RepID=UPI0025F91A5A|nr:hypothetical protein [Chamaesiphon sp. GL140_3_metabinner_50]